MKYFAIIWLILCTCFVLNQIQPWPHFHVTVKEHIGILDETKWYSGNKECAHAYHNVEEEEGWHTFHYYGLGDAENYPDKESAYKAMEWWCRP